VLPAAAPRRPSQADAALIALEYRFDAALAAHETAQRHYRDCEQRFFAACPEPPEILTCDGPLAHLLANDWSWLRAQDLRLLLRDPGRRRLWKRARAALPAAKAYEAQTRRVERASGLAAAEAAHNEAIDTLDDLSLRIAAIPARSLAGLAVKARVVRRWSAPEWWRDGGPAERLAAQVLDAVLRAAEKGA
jgi:hypothetical protein